MKRWRTVAQLLLVGLAVVAVTGCGGPTASSPKGKPGKHAHAHGLGPNKGAVGDWGGGKYHIEFTVDHGKQEATVYILDGSAKKPAPISAKDGELRLTIKEPAFEVVLKAMPQDGDPAGKASRFVGKHEKLGKEQEFEGTVRGEADGTPYDGTFKEEP